MSEIRHPVFFDRSGKRWSRVLRVSAWVALFISLVGAAFSFSIVMLPSSTLSFGSRSYSHGPMPRLESREDAARRFIALKTRNRLLKQIRADQARIASPHVPTGSAYSTVVGFYVNWDKESFASLRQHIDSMSYVMPEWWYLGDDVVSVGSRENDRLTKDGLVRALAKQHNVPIIPMVDNLNSRGEFDWPRLRELLSDPDEQRQLVTHLRDKVVKEGFAGINVDFEPGIDVSSMSASDANEASHLIHDELPRFMRLLTDSFHRQNLLVTQDLIVEQPSMDYSALGKANDFVVVMLYDEHSVSSNPGPIASQDWSESCADDLFNKIDPSKVVLGIGNYCYDWPVAWDRNGDIAEDSDGEIKFAGPATKRDLGSALQIANESGARVQMDDVDLNPYFTYDDGHGQGHIVYMLDSVTAYNQLLALKDYRPRGAAVWYVGSEDPTIWSFLSRGRLSEPFRPSLLGTVDLKSRVTYEWQSMGEIIQVASLAKPGRRRLALGPDGLIESERYTSYPSPYVIERYGDVPKSVAITFDDGPDSVYTPKILKLLKQYHVPATFFVIGKSVDEHPELVSEAWRQGCEIGNHTFTHPHISEVSKLRAELELNATQRMIESITGHSTRLFRPPFGDGADTNPDSMDEIPTLLEVQKLGYVTVGMEIDPSDYESPGVGTIVNRVLHSLHRTVDGRSVDNHVLLLHDGGGNREETVRALPLIIKALQGRGYKLVTVTDLLPPGAYTRIFPPVPQRQGAIAGFDRIVFESGFLSGRLLQIVFLLSIFLGVLRVIVVAPLAIAHWRRESRRRADDSHRPPVTVVIAAYNEERVIGSTIRTVLDCDYQDLKVIVVDDGSVDRTVDVVRAEFGADPRVSVICKENGGKSTALNMGVDAAATDIIVCLDADTVFAPDTVSRLVRHFADPTVGAVAGNVKVGNRDNPLTIWQSVEYISSQNFDRRAYAMLDSVSVVPGAVGAWRRSAILDAGGYSADTLAEDTDLTFRVRLLGYKIVADNGALAYTEAPDSVRSLAKQRFRWAFGTLQCLWKHRRLLMNPKHGAFSMFVMPGMWVYNIFFQAFSPIVDIAVVLSLFNHQFASVAIYYGAFFVLDFLGAALAFALDREDLKQLSWLFWQRFFYRQFMYYIILKSILAALRGGLVGWGKLQRKGTVAGGTARS